MSRREAKRRVSLTVANAQWALANRRRKDLLLYACVQGLDREQYRACAAEYVGLDFDGIAIGGLTPRASELSQVLEIIDSVREMLPDRPIHAFGLGKPEVVAAMYQRGVLSTDSSSYVQLAANGRQWGRPDVQLYDTSATERVHLALCNLAMATQRSLPLAASPLVFHSPVLGPRSSQLRDHT
jgi:helicase